MRKMKNKFNQEFKLPITLIILVLMTVIITAQTEVGKDDIVTVDKDTGNLIINGGFVLINEDYTGDLTIKGGGGTLMFTGNKKHKFPSGTIKIKEGKIAKIKDMDLTEPFEPGFKIHDQDLDLKIKGKIIDFDLDNKILISNEIEVSDITGLYSGALKSEKENFKVIFTDEEVIYDTGTVLAEFSVGETKIGEFKGRFIYDLGDEIILSPSEDQDFAEFKMGGINGKSDKTTLIRDIQLFNIDEGISLPISRLRGGVSTIEYNGDLDVFLIDDNQVSLSFEDETFGYANIHQIKDQSTATLIIENEGQKSEVSLKKDGPLIKSRADSIKTLIGGQFEKDGRVWSFEFSKAKEKIEPARNILYIHSPSFPFDDSDEGLSNFYARKYVDPKTGESMERAASQEIMIKKILSKPLIELSGFDPKNPAKIYLPEVKKTVFLEGKKPHTFTIESREFEDKQSFFSALGKNPQNAEFKEIVLHAHGEPTNIEGEITAEDIRTIDKDSRSNIQRNLRSVESCTAYSCSIFANIGEPNKDNLGMELVNLLKGERTNFYGSVDIIRSNPIFGEAYYSTNYLKISPSKDGDVKVE